MPENEREKKEYSLEERRYIGDDGEVHYHTNVWMQEHAGEMQGKASGRSEGGEKGESRRTESRQAKGGGEGESREAKGNGSSGGKRASSDESEEESGGLAKGLMAAAALGIAGAAAAAVVAVRESHREDQTLEIRESGGRGADDQNADRAEGQGGTAPMG